MVEGRVDGMVEGHICAIDRKPALRALATADDVSFLDDPGAHRYRSPRLNSPCRSDICRTRRIPSPIHPWLAAGDTLACGSRRSRGPRRHTDETRTSYRASSAPPRAG